MLLIDIYRYLKRRADNRPVYLKNFVDQSHHHGTRPEEPSVSVIIPTRDKVELLRACVESVIEKTSYKNYEIIVVDNQSKNQLTLEYFAELNNQGVKILNYTHRFNFSAICNQAALNSDAEYLCFLNNDTEVVDGNWLENLLDHASQKDSGVVGSLLLYPDQTIQHSGIALGHKGLARHASTGLNPKESGNERCHLVSGATFACVVVSKQKYIQLRGLDEKFSVGLNDVDFCVRTVESGLANILCERSVLVHHESKTRGKIRRPSAIYRAALEVILFLRRHGQPSGDKFFSSFENNEPRNL